MYTGLDELHRLMRKAGLPKDKRAMRLYRAFIRTGDQSKHQKLLKLCQRKISEDVNKNGDQLLSSFIPLREPLQGPIWIAKDRNTGEKIGLRPKDLQHLTVYGKSGFGKTSLRYLIIPLAVDLGIKVWDFCLKREGRNLINRCDNLYPLKLSRLKFNPYQSPVETKDRRREHWSALSEVFCQAKDLLSASRRVIKKSIPLLERDYRNEKRWPTLEDHKRLINQVGKKFNPSDSESKAAKRIVSAMEALEADFPDVFDVQQGYPIQDLMEENVSFEFDGDSVDNALVIFNWLLVWLYHRKLWTDDRSPQVRNLLVFDEGEEIFHARADKQSTVKGMPWLSRMVNKARAYGIAVICLSQSAFLSKAIKVNSRTIIAFNITDNREKQEVGATLGLNRDEYKELPRQKVREVIIRVTERRDHPIVATIDQVKVPQSVTDAQVEAHTKNFIRRMEKLVVPAKNRQNKKGKESIDSTHLRILLNTASHPFDTVAEQRKTLAIAASSMKKILENLENLGLVKLVPLNTGRRGRSSPLIELTDKGKSYLKSFDEKIRFPQWRSGILEAYWVNQLKEKFEPEVDKVIVDQEFIKGVYPDLTLHVDDQKRVLVEVEVEYKGLYSVKKYLSHLELIHKIAIMVDGKSNNFFKGDFCQKLKKEAQSQLGSDKLAKFEFWAIQDFFQNGNLLW